MYNLFVFLHYIVILIKFKKKKTHTLIWVKSSKVMSHCPAIDLFSWEREGNSYISTLVKTFKTSKSALSDHKSLQRTHLDPQCVYDTLQNCPFLQNYMYILCKFCTFPVTEGNEILHLHFSSQPHTENSLKNP